MLSIFCHDAQEEVSTLFTLLGDMGSKRGEVFWKTTRTDCPIDEDEGLTDLIVMVVVVEFDQGMHKLLHSSHVFMETLDLVHVGAFLFHHSGGDGIGDFR